MLEEVLVDELGQRVGVGVLGLLRFLVPDERQLLGGVVEGVLALLHLVLLDALHLGDAVVDRAQALDLLDLIALVPLDRVLRTILFCHSQMRGDSMFMAITLR